jgi:hypothetical protein
VIACKSHKKNFKAFSINQLEEKCSVVFAACWQVFSVGLAADRERPSPYLKTFARFPRLNLN